VSGDRPTGAATDGSAGTPVPDRLSLDLRAGHRLAGKVAIVTGAGQGIGHAVARRLAAERALVMAADRGAEGAERTATELWDHGADARAFVGDLTDPAQAEALVAATVEWQGRVDVLVNAVGGATRFKPLWEWAPDEIRAEMDRSLLPTLWCTLAVLGPMRAAGRGRIVNVGAESVRNGLWDRAPYNVAKGGVHALTTSVARELAEVGITCNCVAPGGTNSAPDRLVPRYAPSDDPDEPARRERLRQRVLTTIPMGRRAEIEEQAAAIAFLASDDASFITGQVLSVNGGSSML
jgi:NAD(P)-dependent dehydrogenase (short-subunit alcohol dehydrogenase family)